MEWLASFSSDYANAVIAIAASIAVLLAAVTLWYLRREYYFKFRPYVFPNVHIEPSQENLGFYVSIIPHNHGSFPCKIKLSEIRLCIGDEIYPTPDNQDWIFLGQGINIQIPAGSVNETGITKVREGRYRENRIEISFVLNTISFEDKFEEQKRFSYEINVLNQNPQLTFRPEWIREKYKSRKYNYFT